MRTFCLALNETLFFIVGSVALALPLFGAFICASLAIDWANSKYGLYRSDLVGFGALVGLLHCSVWLGIGLVVRELLA